ncbi:MAG: hypothetical protein ACOCRK_12070 [bacterium]
MAKNFESDIKKVGDYLNVWYRRLRDVNHYKGSQSPFDFLFWNGVVLVGIECKEISKNSSAKSLSLDEIKDHQINGLKLIDSFNNSLGIYLVNFRNIEPPEYITDKRVGRGRAYILKPEKMLEGKNKFEGKRKSIPLKWFQEECSELKYLEIDKGYSWDITDILNRELGW